MKYTAGANLAVLVFFSVSVVFLWAGENHMNSPLALKTKAIVETAHAYIVEHQDDMPAIQKALQSDPRFIDRDRGLYVFMHCYNAAEKEAICCGQGMRPELVNKNMWHLRTPNGRLLFHELIQMIERDGEGWIEYDWLNPQYNKIQTKVSFVKGILLNDGRKAWVGGGFWKSD